MFIGHFAVGFAAKKVAPRTSLLWLLAASQLADVLWPWFLLLGWEHVRIDRTATRYTPLDFYDYPWSHSLAALLVWATTFAFLYWLVTRYRAGAVMIWIAVLSHWVLDWATHRPDMEIWPGGPRYGFGLWNSIPATMLVEIAIYTAGVGLYLRATRARNRVGHYGCAAYVVLLLAIYVMNSFSPPPPSVSSIVGTAVIAIPILLLIPWWFDRNRESRVAA